MSDVLQQIKTSCAWVGGPNPGTGYVVAPNRLATCHHVVEHWTEGETHPIWFGPDAGVQQARVIKVDERADAAILGFDGQSPPPLLMAKTLERKAVWDGYGFPRLANHSTIDQAHAHPSGLPLDGIVKDPNARDDIQRPALLLYSEQIAAGTASPLHGFSGTPVLVSNAVVGHLTKYLGDPDDRQRAAYGYVYACPISAVRALLDVPPTAVDIVVPETTSVSMLIPSIPPDDYHAFISYRSTDRPWALSLQARLEGAGYRVFLDQAELKPGDSIAGTLQKALARSHAGIVLVSHGWVESPWCQEEAHVLVTRAAQESTFRLFPLRLDDAELPPMLATRRWLDFRGRASADGPELHHLLYALSGRVPPAVDAATERIESGETRTVDDFLIQIRAAAPTGPDRVLKALDDWRQVGASDEAPLLVAAEMLIGTGRPDLALEILGTNRRGVRARQLRALALGKSKANDAAIEILERLREEGNLDAETSGILAGQYKTRWFKRNDRGALEASYQLYLETYEQTGDAYNGINAAAMALHCDDKPTMYGIAAEVRASLQTAPVNNRDPWPAATMGEAYLLEGRLDQAKDWYRKAVGIARGRHQDIAVMRRGARRDLQKLGRRADELDPIFPIPAVVAFAGHMVDLPNRANARFPASKVANVQLAIRRRLQALHNPQGFCSAARGADILFIEEILQCGGTPTVILPFPEPDFLSISGGHGWNERFHDVRKDVELVVLRQERPAPQDLAAAFATANREIQRRATQYAELLDEHPVALAVWDGQPGDGPGGTADTIALWRQQGIEPDIIDISTL